LKVVALIEQYATLTDALLVWVHELRAQVEKERRLADLEEVRIKERWEELKKDNKKGAKRQGEGGEGEAVPTKEEGSQQPKPGQPKPGPPTRRRNRGGA
jgi:hypothetical protein